MSVAGIAENMVADLIFIALAILVAWAWTALTQRRKLLDFFNVHRTKRLPIYLSNIYVQAFGSVGISGVRLSYQGEAVAHGEVQGANQIRNLFTFIVPKLAEASEQIGRILLSDVQVPVLLSPRDRRDLESVSPYVAFGSPAYNLASEYVEKSGKCYATFRLGAIAAAPGNVPPFSAQPPAPTSYSNYTQTTIVERVLPGINASGTADAFDPRFRLLPEMVQNSTDGQPTQPPAIVVAEIPPFTDTTYGFVQRVWDTVAQRSLFYVAGLSEFSTRAAANYLSAEWRTLYRKYGPSKPFLILLKFDAQDYTRWTLVLEKTAAD